MVLFGDTRYWSPNNENLICMMKLLLFSFFGFYSLYPISWSTNMEEAMKTAQEKHQLILLNFSGSDWCGPCIRLHKEIFDSPEFESFAANQLICVTADFPRLKKNKLPKALQDQNDKLADRYNAAGNFPCTLLLSADGKILKEWDGFPRQGLHPFLEEINVAMHAGN
jgi:thiol-disulfide isomerase/thioredoxin